MVEWVVSIASVALTAWLVFEGHEDRLTRDRPFVFVDFLSVGLIEGSGAREYQAVHELSLRIRNEGRSPAVDIHIVPTLRLLDRDGSDVLENPVLREGLSFLGPGQAMSTELYEDTVTDQLYEQAPTYLEGEKPPPPRPLRVAWRVEYREGITGRRYSEAFTVDLNVGHYGWTTSTIKA